MKTQLKSSKKLNKQAGANAVEYGLVMALVTGGMLVLAKNMDGPIGTFFTKAADNIKDMVGG